MRKSPINVAIFVFIYFPKALMPGCKRSGINVFYLLIIFSGIVLPHFSYVSFAVMLRINISHKHSVCIIAALPHLTVAFTHLHNNTFSERFGNIDITFIKAGDYRNVTVTADKIAHLQYSASHYLLVKPYTLSEIRIFIVIAGSIPCADIAQRNTAVIQAPRNKSGTGHAVCIFRTRNKSECVLPVCERFAPRCRTE